MHRLHAYPDVQVMFRRLVIAMLVGVFAALAVALFRHAMAGLESLFLSNDSGSLVNAAESMPGWRPCVIIFSLITSVAPSARSAFVSRTVESTPLIWVVSISI